MKGRPSSGRCPPERAQVVVRDRKVSLSLPRGGRGRAGAAAIAIALLFTVRKLQGGTAAACLEQEGGERGRERERGGKHLMAVPLEAVRSANKGRPLSP